MLFLKSRGANCWVYLSLPMVWCWLFNRWWCSIILSCNLLLGPARPFLTRPAAPITFLLPLAFPFSPSFLLSTLFLSKLSFLSPINCTWSTCRMMTFNFQTTVKLTLEFVSSLVKQPWKLSQPPSFPYPATGFILLPLTKLSRQCDSQRQTWASNIKRRVFPWASTLSILKCRISLIFWTACFNWIFSSWFNINAFRLVLLHPRHYPLSWYLNFHVLDQIFVQMKMDAVYRVLR